MTANVGEVPAGKSGGLPDLVVVGAGTMGAWTAFWANERFSLGTTRVDDATLRTGADAMVSGWQGY